MSDKIEFLKSRFKRWSSQHGGLMLLGSAVVIAFGMLCVVLGFYLAGADILAWFTSRWAFLLYAAIVLWLFIVAAIWYWGRMSKK